MLLSSHVYYRLLILKKNGWSHLDLIVFCGEREPPEVIQSDLGPVELHEMDSTRHACTSQSNSTVATWQWTNQESVIKVGEEGFQNLKIFNNNFFFEIEICRFF